MSLPESYEDAYLGTKLEAEERQQRLRWDAEHLVTPNFRRDGPTWWERIKHFLQRLNPYR